MASLGTSPQIAQVGSLTAPDHIAIALSSEIGGTLKETGLFYAIPLPSIKGSVLFCHGTEAMRHMLGTSSYRLGILAPQASQTVASTGVKATAVITFTAATNPANGDQFYLGTDFMGLTVTTNSVLSTTGNTIEIKRGSGGTGAQNLASTIARIKGMFNGTAVAGTDYYWGDPTHPYTTFLSNYDVTVSATTANTVTFQAKAYGIYPNTNMSLAETLDSGGTWAVTSFAGGVDGTGSAPAAGEYSYAYQHLRTGDGALSGRSALASLVQTAAANVNQTAFVAASTRFAPDYYRQNRSTTGAVDLWRVQDTAIGTGEPYVDSLPDGVEGQVSSLVGVGAVPYEDAIYRLYAGGCPTICKCAAVFKGAVWMGGADISADITTGTVTATLTSYQITFSAPRVAKEAIIGRTITISGDVTEYLICDVSESGGTAQLNLPFAGAGGSGLSYTLADKRNPFALYHSVPLLPNNFPTSNQLDDITSSDPVGITAMRTAWDSLVVWTKTGVWRVYGDDTSGYRLENVGEGMGCFSAHSVVDVEGVLFWLGRDGIYQWRGSGDPMNISKVSSPVGAFPKGIKRTLERINQDEADMIVSVYDPSARTITWACPMDGDLFNNDAIIYDIQTTQLQASNLTGAFTTDTVGAITSLASVPGVNGSPVTLAGTAFGDIFQLELGNSDGCFSVEPVQTYSAYALSTLTTTLLGSPGLPTSSGGLAGVPVIHVSNLGDIQINVISSNTASAFITVYPWDTSPSNGVFVIGGIWLDVLTAKYDFGDPNVFKWIDRTIVSFVPQDLGRLYLAAGADNRDPTLFRNRALGGSDYADLSVTDGSKDFPCRTDRAHRLSQRFVALAPGFDVILLEFQTTLGLNEPISGSATGG